MSGRFSFDNDDETSFAPKRTNTQTQPQFQSARGREYEVPSSQHYLSQEPSPVRSYHDDERIGQADHDRAGYSTLIDTTPKRGAQPYHIPPPLEQAQRDPHDFSVPVPPPHRRMSSSDSHDRGAAYGAAGGAAAGIGAGAAMDTAYQGAGNYQDYQPYNPFEHAQPSNMEPPAHGYPEYPQNPLDDPFASNRTSYNNLALPTSYEMQQQPVPGQRPNSFNDPYGSYDHAASAGDLGHFDPSEIADEDDDTGALAAKRRDRGAAATAAAGVAGAAAFAKGVTSRDASGKYNAIPGGNGNAEKGTHIVGQASKNKRTMWFVGGVIAIIIVLAIVGGVVGAYITSHKNSSSSTSGENGSDYDSNSSEIKKLMNNKDLHKVFPGMDYTPFGAQYPACLSNMPSQNNVTMDVAVLSQLTPQIRLYGTDCNQTEMVLTAIDKLNLKDDVKVWLGVYLNGNQTTNDRQIDQMWNILQGAGADPFQGIIVGNEVLFSNYMPEQKLTDILDEVRSNLTSRNLQLPLATSDLGDNWNDTLAQHVDWVMANVHPFFGGVAIDQAASWTYTYWQENDVGKTNNLPGKKQLIAETGWPSEGGNDCTNQNGASVPCPNPTAGAVASVDNMNTFMNDWVCQALQNGTQYFYFEAFDEPWKVQFNKPGQEWEDKWGLMDPGRNLKPGLKIPDCGGKTASLPT